MQCGPENDDLWNKAEQETELAKQEACNVKAQISKTTEIAETAASTKHEVCMAFTQGECVALVSKCCYWTVPSDTMWLQANELAKKASNYERKVDEIRAAGDSSRKAIPGDERAVEAAKQRVRDAEDELSPAK